LSTDFESEVVAAEFAERVRLNQEKLRSELYNQVIRNLDLDKNPPSGWIFHVAIFSIGTLCMLDRWESQQAFEKFKKVRFTAAVQKAGITSQPKVQSYPVHNIHEQ